MILLFVAASAAWAQPSLELYDAPKSPHELAGELLGDHAPSQLFAARELRRRLRMIRSRSEARDALVATEARIELADMSETLLVPAVEALVRYPRVRAACADMLAEIGDPMAIPKLRAVRETETRRRVLRKIDRALSSLEQS